MAFDVKIIHETEDGEEVELELEVEATWNRGYRGGRDEPDESEGWEVEGWEMADGSTMPVLSDSEVDQIYKALERSREHVYD